MENRSSWSTRPSLARQQLREARRAHDASVRRALAPAWFILALSVLCGALTVAPRYKGSGNVVSIIAVGLAVAALIGMSARHQWRALRAWPQPKWDRTELALICAAVLMGAGVGPHLLAGHGHSALVSWGLGAAVTVVVAACLFLANASYRRRVSRVWHR